MCSSLDFVKSLVILCSAYLEIFSDRNNRLPGNHAFKIGFILGKTFDCNYDIRTSKIIQNKPNNLAMSKTLMPNLTLVSGENE